MFTDATSVTIALQPTTNVSHVGNFESAAKCKTHKQNGAYVRKSLIAGGIAGCAAKTVIAPLDRAKILFQTNNPQYAKYSGTFLGVFRAIREIYSLHGIPGLFQGHSATILRIFPYAAVKFSSYEQYKDWIMPRKEDETPFRRTVAGSMAGVSSLFVSYPLDLLRTRMACENRIVTNDGRMKNVGLVDVAKLIWREENLFTRKGNIIGGIANFYRGFMPTVYGVIPYAGVTFCCYEGMKASALERKGWWIYKSGSESKEAKRQLVWWAQLLVGGVSGVIGETISYPLEVIRRQMQVAGTLKTTDGVKRFPTTMEIGRTIYATKGMRGFFVGLSIGFLKVVPLHAVSFYVYEYMKTVLDI